MYLGKRTILDPEKHETRRAELLQDKSGAIFLTFSELEGLLNITQLAKQYFGKTHGWLSQKIHGSDVCDKRREFSQAEAHQLAESLRDIAKRLNAHADEIDNAPNDN